MRNQRVYPPAWYPDPDHPSRLRRWDGLRWTRDIRPPPAWVRSVVLAPGPGGGHKRRTSRWLWATSASLVVLAFAFMAYLTTSGGTDVDRISDAEFARQADALCAATRTDTVDVNPATGSAGPEEGRRMAALAGGFGSMVERLRDLEVAAGDTVAVELWLGAWDEFVAIGHRRSEALLRGDGAGAERANAESRVPKQAVDSFARVNGLGRCLF